MGALLSVRDLHVTFAVPGGAIEAVRGVSFDLDRGETLAVVGESGSGKSVTALSILQLLPYPMASHSRSSSVVFQGQELVGASEAVMRDIRGNRIAMVFQEPMTSLNPLHTIEKQLLETLYLHKRMDARRARERILELLRLVGLGDAEQRLDAYPHQLSGGQRQRVMIAMALANEPDILIADEPTTALDVTIQAQILELMKQLTRRLDVALIIITHNLGVVARYANRVNVMYAGRIVESGPAAAIYHDPRHPYTMALLRSVPRLDRPRQARLDPVEGQPPDLTRLDIGCAFRPRCRFAVEACAVSRPPLQPAADRAHFAACFRSNEIAAESATPATRLLHASDAAAP